ncbi:RNA polymerase sigma factor [Actinocrispum wychmicini]|uniref:RNA polymerase sigma factor (Sigma-70 family) n=1 Tax=Actinocrispum wychmicini TaxID=1213861 RepID=A0A4V2S874_9PSEU|nr:sigma-70 family RNA polymerase sigma factor [Actinocrispum wychmicini]TCO62750.1 RNA polymerase sigma factor (sigma-70 family) [Actinocrispum wychmicini]
MRNEPSTTALLTRAAQGAESAWQEIFRRYTPFVVGVCRRYRIYGADAEDVCGTVWLQLVTNVNAIRDPQALPGWLATTAGRECLALLRDKRRQVPSQSDVVDRVEPAVDVSLLVDERRDAVRRAFDRLPDRDRVLLSMLFADPPRSYADISSQLGMPIGAIGPTRQRCLARVRRSAAIAALLADDDHRRSA